MEEVLQFGIIFHIQIDQYFSHDSSNFPLYPIQLLLQTSHTKPHSSFHPHHQFVPVAKRGIVVKPKLANLKIVDQDKKANSLSHLSMRVFPKRPPYNHTHGVVTHEDRITSN